jgi:hypothetical protein
MDNDRHLGDLDTFPERTLVGRSVFKSNAHVTLGCVNSAPPLPVPRG